MLTEQHFKLRLIYLGNRNLNNLQHLVRKRANRQFQIGLLVVKISMQKRHMCTFHLVLLVLLRFQEGQLLQTAESAITGAS